MNTKEYKKIVDYVIDLVRKGEIKVGEKLPTERALSTELQISRNSTREALRYLENMGVIECKQGSGNYVTCDISRTLSSMLDMMLCLEKFNREELDYFRKSIDKMVCSIIIEKHEDLDNVADRAMDLLQNKVNSVEDEIEIDKNFHMFLVNETDNRLLILLLKAMAELYRSAIDSVLAVANNEQKKGFVNAHIEIVDAIRKGSKAKCDAAVEKHYMFVEETVKQAKLDEYIKERKSKQKELNLSANILLDGDEDSEYIYEKDYLTGLYNKDKFFFEVDKYIKEHPDEKLLLWASDIQGLRYINEKYGVDSGDRVIQCIAEKGKGYEDYIFGGRIDGGSFCALMKDIGLDFGKINDLLLDGSENNELDIPNVIVKNGIYFIEKDDILSSKAMYVRAVVALQSIKNSCDYVIKVYDEKMREEILINRQMEEDAKKSLLNGEFKVFFQPKIDVAQKKIGGAEALVRWIHPKLGFMNPGMFIPLFEKNGFIKKIDLFVWEEVCKSIVEWKNKGIALVPISVNVSKKSFEDENLAEKIIEIVDKYEIDHNLIEIEMTEYSCLGDMEKIYNTIRTLHKSGFPIALDDFGTGYSSMIVLSKFDLDTMKLDMSLIRNDNPRKKKNALEFALQLAKMMQLKTVAEGIETEEQAERIRSLGGDYIQGYFYSKPLPKDEFEKYLKEGIK